MYRIQSHMDLAAKRFGKFSVYCLETCANPDTLIQQFHNPYKSIKGGRGGIKLIRVDNDLFACRRYVHGGILRAITGCVFFSEKRVASEFSILNFLQEHDFPVVHPFGYLVKDNLFTKDLYLLTLFEEDTFEFLEFLQSAPRKKRFRAIRDLARLLFRMGELGVYHPDFHLQNVLVRKTGELIFLDFDRACLKEVSKKEMEKMLWRLNRFAEKKERAGELSLTAGERRLFLRTIERLSGIRFIEDMKKRLGKKRLFYKSGWLMESTFYGKQGKING